MITQGNVQAETARQLAATEAPLSRENCVRSVYSDWADEVASLYNAADECEGESLRNYEAEGNELVNNLKTDTLFCRRFFFDTEVINAKGESRKKACQIASLRSKVIFDLKRDFSVEVDPDDFSSIVYQTLWAGGSWATLNSYQGRSSFYAWLRKVARNAVLNRLLEDQQISGALYHTVGNTRLAMLSKSPMKCKLVIDSLLSGSKYYALLTAVYVERLPKATVMVRLHMDDSKYEATKRSGENKLKDALLRSPEFSEEDFIRGKVFQPMLVSQEDVIDQGELSDAKKGPNPLADVFGTDLTDEEISVRTVDFLYDFSTKMKWSDQDRYIWCRRFIVNADPESVAYEVGRDRAWLDTRYSRLNKKFEEAVRIWWYSHAA